MKHTEEISPGKHILRVRHEDGTVGVYETPLGDPEVLELRAALTTLYGAFIRLNNGCYPLPYPDSDRWKYDAVQAADKVLYPTI
jgi:hypothetical protein